MFISLQMKCLEICFLEDFKVEDTFLGFFPPKNVDVLLQIRLYTSTTYCKSTGIGKLQTRLSRNYDFVFTNF